MISPLDITSKKNVLKSEKVDLETRSNEENKKRKKGLDSTFKSSVDNQKKNRGYWKQRYRPSSEAKENVENLKNKKIKKSLKYVVLLQKPFSKLHFKNIKILKLFLTKHGKIKPRRKTRISLSQQRKLSKAIRKARYFGLLPFTCLVKEIRKDFRREGKRVRKNLSLYEKSTQ